jgi:hypothetical protein
MSSVENVVDLVRSAALSGHWGKVVQLYDEADDDAKESYQLKEMLSLALLCLGRYSEVLDIHGIDRGSKVWVIAEDLHDKDLGKKHNLVRQIQPINQIAYISMVKDEEDIIFHNLLWHYNIGFRKFVLVDNASVDGTRKEIERFSRTFNDLVVIIINDPVVAHLQSEFTTAAFRVACSIWPEIQWVFPIDADEFLCTERPLGDILSEVPEAVNAILICKSQYMPVLGSSYLEENLPFYKKICHRTPISHNSSKVVVRSHVYLEIEQGNHGAAFQGRDIKSYMGGLSLGMHYREFFLRSWGHARKKVINGGRAIEAAEAMGKRDVGGDHWKAWYKMFITDGDRAIGGILRSHLRNPNNLIHDPFPMVAADASSS